MNVSDRLRKKLLYILTFYINQKFNHEMAEEVMEVQPSDIEQKSEEKQNDENNFCCEIIDHLVTCKDAFFRSQQRGEDELSTTEKKEIANKIVLNSKSGFLSRFGKQLKEEHLEYFKQFMSDEDDGYAISYYLADLKRYFTAEKRKKDIKNRRYDALKKLVKENQYFTETEMMRRNPLLYDQLVGQYLSEDERKKRDNIDTKNITFVNLLLESIDRDTIRKKQKQQEVDEEDTKEEIDSPDSEEETKPSSNKNNLSDSWDEEMPLTAKWGEFETPEERVQPVQRFNLNFFDKPEPQKEVVMITATERRLLKEEFISIMYQNFLDGKDSDFDYTTVDNNDEYDNLDIKTHDAEDSYFDSETPEDVPTAQEDAKMTNESETSEEDELDAFMNRLNKHPTVQQLSEDMNKL